MDRCLALIGAVLCAFVSISSACMAAPAEWIHFTLEPQRGSGNDTHIQARFRREGPGDQDNDWSSGFRPTDLVGLDVAGFRAGGTRPLRFAVIREAGRLDCGGNGGESYAAGDCGFAPDPAFTRLLVSRGIGRPSDEQAFGLMAVNAKREVIDAIAGTRYPTPSIDNLMALSALGVNDAYISDMARAGYRPRTLDALIQFKALDITPEWIAGFVRIGYADLSADELVQLKALDITPEFVRSVAAADGRLPPVDHLLMLKMFTSRRQR